MNTDVNILVERLQGYLIGMYDNYSITDIELALFIVARQVEIKTFNIAYEAMFKESE